MAQRRRAVWQYEYRRLQARARELNPGIGRFRRPPTPPATPPAAPSPRPRNRVTVPPAYREALREQLQQQVEWQIARSAGAAPVQLIQNITHEVRPRLVAARNRGIFALASARTNAQACQQAGDAEASRYWKEQVRILKRTDAVRKQFAEYWESRLAEGRERIRAEHAAHDNSWPPPAPLPLPPVSSASGCEGWLQAGLTFRPDYRQPGNFLVRDAASGVSLGCVDRHVVNRTRYYRYCSPQGQLQDSYMDWKRMKHYIIHQTERINRQARLCGQLYTTAPPYPALNPVPDEERGARLEPAAYAAAVMKRLNLTLTPVPEAELPATGPSAVLRLTEAANGAVRWQLERETASLVVRDPVELWHAARAGGTRDRISHTFAGILDYALVQELEQEEAKRLTSPQGLPARIPQPAPVQMPPGTAPAAASPGAAMTTGPGARRKFIRKSHRIRYSGAGPAADTARR